MALLVSKWLDKQSVKIEESIYISQCLGG